MTTRKQTRIASMLATLPFAALMLGGFTAMPAQAAIIVGDEAGFASTTGSTGGVRTVTAGTLGDELGDFNANGADKLVVTISGERAGTANNTVSGVTYGGAGLTEAIQDASGVRKASIWYLDDVTTTGDIVVTFVSNQSGIGLSAVALDGTVAGDPADTSVSSSLDTTTSGEFVIAAAYKNGGGPLTADPPLTQLYTGDTGSSFGSAGYTFVATPGSFTPSFSGDDGFVAASFQAIPPIPEPASLALAGLGLLSLGFTGWRRRRR